MGVLPLAAALVLAAFQDPLPPRKPPQDLTEMSLEELMKIEVTSVSKREQQFIVAPAAIAVIRGDDIRRTGVTSIPEALRMVPGVFVGRSDANKWAVGVRGFSDLFSNKLLVLIDGRSVYNPLFSGVFWDVQDTFLEDIDRIEVIRGPGSTLWGANAVNGVINVTTKKARDTQGGVVSVLGGNQEQFIAGARYGGKVGEDVYYRAYVKYGNHDAFTGGNDDWWLSQAGFRTEWVASKADTLTVQGDLYDGEMNQLLRMPSLATPPVQEYAAPTLVHGGNLLARYEHDFESGAQGQVQVYWDRTTRLWDLLDETRDTLDLDLQVRFQLPWSQELTLGGGYRWTTNRTDGSFAATLDPDHRTDDVVSTFVQDEISLVPGRLTLILGSKFEYNSYTQFEVEPGARMSWRPHDRHTVWASASRAVRTPSQFEDDIISNAQVLPGAPPTVRRFTGDHSFDSEELRAYEMGYRVMPIDPLMLDIAVFFNDYRSLRTSEVASVTPPPPNTVVTLVPDNNLEGHTYGFEVAATWRAADTVRFYGTYSFLRMHLHTVNGSVDTAGDTVEDSSPRSIVYLRGSWEPAKDLSVDLIGRFVSSIPHWDVKKYTEMDARLGWTISKNLEASIVGQNLLHTSHYETGDSQFTPATKVQRGGYLGVTWKF